VPCIYLLLAAVAVVAGAIAAVTGFGIGSLLTPVLADEHEATISGERSGPPS